MSPNKVLVRFISDYFSRHRHPVNLALHLVGVPQAFWGMYQLVAGNWRWGMVNSFLGYLSQWLGHFRFEGNEMGEVLLIKKIVARLLTHTGDE